MLIYSPVWFVCQTNMADSALWLVRSPVSQTPCEGSVAPLFLIIMSISHNVTLCLNLISLCHIYFTLRWKQVYIGCRITQKGLLWDKDNSIWLVMWSQHGIPKAFIRLRALEVYFFYYIYIYIYIQGVYIIYIYIIYIYIYFFFFFFFFLVPFGEAIAQNHTFHL